MEMAKFSPAWAPCGIAAANAAPCPESAAKTMDTSNSAVKMYVITKDIPPFQILVCLAVSTLITLSS
jgi:hypothetical protein